MNRLHHIMETLPANMASNQSYQNLEFVLLDYNSGDGLKEWVVENYKNELKSGKLVFERTDLPDHFEWSRSRNMAFGRASGDIVCNVDADNFTGPDFAGFINSHFRTNPNSYLSIDHTDNFNIPSDIFGRIACYKKDFEAVGGFDERMEGYGYEDIDFCLRLGLLGRKQHFITDKKYFKTIKHGYEDRFSNAADLLKTKMVLIDYQSPFKSVILFLFKDGRCAYGTLLDLDEGMGNPTIDEGWWVIGKHQADKDNNVLIDMPDYSMKLSAYGENLIGPKGRVYYNIRDKNYLKKLETLYSILGNHQILINNMKEKRVRVN